MREKSSHGGICCAAYDTSADPESLTILAVALTAACPAVAGVWRRVRIHTSSVQRWRSAAIA
eukprot:277439-Chlamydomonas_euryale.AAC.2